MVLFRTILRRRSCCTLIVPCLLGVLLPRTAARLCHTSLPSVASSCRTFPDWLPVSLQQSVDLAFWPVTSCCTTSRFVASYAVRSTGARYLQIDRHAAACSSLATRSTLSVRRRSARGRPLVGDRASTTSCSSGGTPALLIACPLARGNPVAERSEVISCPWQSLYYVLLLLSGRRVENGRKRREGAGGENGLQDHDMARPTGRCSPPRSFSAAISCT